MNASIPHPSRSASYAMPSAAPSYAPRMAPPSMNAPSRYPAHSTTMRGYAPSGFVPQRATTYPALPALHYRTPGTPVTASQALQSSLDEARASKKTDSSTRLKSLVAFFVFWVVVSSLFLFLYVDRMI